MTCFVFVTISSLKSDKGIASPTFMLLLLHDTFLDSFILCLGMSLKLMKVSCRQDIVASYF